MPGGDGEEVGGVLEQAEAVRLLLSDVLAFLRTCCSPGADALQAKVEAMLGEKR